jgi:putative DNA primase/helicase
VEDADPFGETTSEKKAPPDSGGDGKSGAIFDLYPQMTQAGDAERFAYVEKGRALYCAPEETWYLWSGKHWERDRKSAIMGLVFDHVRRLVREVAVQEHDQKRWQEITTFLVGLEGVHRARAMLTWAGAFLPIVPERFDVDPWILNLGNGTLDLRTGELGPHNVGCLCSKLAEVDYSTEATCPLWTAFLERVMAGDAEKIAFLQRAVGYSLTGATGEQCWFLLYGRGANGKSTFLRILRAVAGDYARQIDTATLLAQRRDGGAPSPDLAALRGARIVTAQEPEEGRRLADSLLKQLTGEDAMSARHLHAEMMTFEPTAKVWLAANHKPEVRDTSVAMWRRVRLVPFTVQIPEEERDPDLYLKLTAELPGILAWAVQGCLAWQREGLKAPDAIRSATEEYRLENDALGRFLEEQCELDFVGEIVNKDLLLAYAQWAQEAGERSLSARTLAARMREAGYESRVGKARNLVWMGVTLTHLQSTQSKQSKQEFPYEGLQSSRKPPDSPFLPLDHTLPGQSGIGEAPGEAPDPFDEREADHDTSG